MPDVLRFHPQFWHRSGYSPSIKGYPGWAADSAGFLPKLADAVPNSIETVTIYAHTDKAGRDGAHKLAAKLRDRNIEVTIEGLDRDG